MDVILVLSPSPWLLIPKTMSKLISTALGRLLSLRWMACKVGLFAKGHWIYITFSLKFIPERSMSISFYDPSVIMLTKLSMNLLRHSLFCGIEFWLKFRYWIDSQFLLMTSIRSASYLPWILMLLRLRSCIWGMLTTICFILSIKTNSSISTWANLRRVSLFDPDDSAYNKRLRSCLVDLTLVMRRSWTWQLLSLLSIWVSFSTDFDPISLLT